MDISMRMAEVVADGLIKQGLKANSIVVSGMGEGNLVKSTADGVIESHNGRVEIKVHQAAQPTEPMVISDARGRIATVQRQDDHYAHLQQPFGD